MALVDQELIRDAELNDSLLQLGPDFQFIAAVADGIGGESGGSVASATVLADILGRAGGMPPTDNPAEIYEFLREGCQVIHENLVRQGQETPGLLSMGTTLTGLFSHAGTLSYLHVGDSRLYRYRDGILRQLTRDHSLRAASGISTAPKNVIVNSFGGQKPVEVDIDEAGVRVLAGDAFLLCTDGLSDMVSDDEMESILARPDAVQGLLKAAHDNGGQDNITFVLIRVLDSGGHSDG
ncbi:MAG: serine/threonine-protein phosphatase [Pseudomonadales bacterium]|nr:serine/threonine-protein phosphatase [Pseudomonadales bacterium]